jgi:MFS family permease
LLNFITIWAGQLISVVGSGLTSFAVGIWVYQRTRSITDFALISVFVTLPGILISPFSGAIVDRINRRTAMLVSDLAAGICTFIIALLFFTHRLQLWEIYFLVAIGSLSAAFRFPAYLALLSQLVPAKQVGRASGMMQLGPGAAQVVAPILAAALIVRVGFSGVVLIDATTFFVAITTLLMVKVPNIAGEGKSGRRSVVKEAGQGWIYVKARPGFGRAATLFCNYQCLAVLFSGAINANDSRLRGSQGSGSHRCNRRNGVSGRQPFH